MARLALFPLQLVLFPGLSLELQIFEQRYLKLVSRSLQRDEPFGIVAIEEGQESGAIPSFQDIGTSVKISDWTQLDSGLLGIRVEGGQRFRVLETESDPDNLIWAEVEWLDEEVEVGLSERFQGLQQLLVDLAKHPGAATFGLDPESLSASRLGFQLAQVLPLHDNQKLELLKMNDPLERLERLSLWVEQLSQR